jgi:GTPase Era involved in 16S rRNA processing
MSFTQEVSAYRVLGHEKYGNKLVLVDTPGFESEDTSLKVLENISVWMTRTYVGVSHSGLVIKFLSSRLDTNEV